MTSKYEAMLDRIKGKKAKVGIIGLGYVGLPLAKTFASKGFPVLGFDIDAGKIDKLKRRQSYIKNISEGTIREMFNCGFDATSDFERLAEADAIIICVPTPLSEYRDPDLSFIVKTAQSIGRKLRPGQLVVLESTTYPGTTRDVVQPILEERGLRASSDFFLAFSPEREDPGNARYSTATIPKVVGGLDAQSLDLAATLYGLAVSEVIRVSSPEVAEACKILENTYRAVNIALVNELKVLYDRMGIDVWEVIDAAKTKPFGFQAFYPGPGLGGHCIPIDPFYLTWVARKFGLSTRFIELAGEVNTAMPHYVVSRIADVLNDRGLALKGSQIAVLGIAYKKDVDDPRESPGLELMELLLKRGATVTYNDPHIPRLPPTRRHPELSELPSQALTPEYLNRQDCVLIVTDHTAYDWPWIVGHSSLVVDTRNATKQVKTGRERIVRA